jgi:hypothetical protein
MARIANITKKQQIGSSQRYLIVGHGVLPCMPIVFDNTTL